MRYPDAPVSAGGVLLYIDAQNICSKSINVCACTPDGWCGVTSYLCYADVLFLVKPSDVM